MWCSLATAPPSYAPGSTPSCFIPLRANLDKSDGKSVNRATRDRSVRSMQGELNDKGNSHAGRIDCGGVRTCSVRRRYGHSTSGFGRGTRRSSARTTSCHGSQCWRPYHRSIDGRGTCFFRRQDDWNRACVRPMAMTRLRRGSTHTSSLPPNGRYTIKISMLPASAKPAAVVSVDAAPTAVVFDNDVAVGDDDDISLIFRDRVLTVQTWRLFEQLTVEWRAAPPTAAAIEAIRSRWGLHRRSDSAPRTGS